MKHLNTIVNTLWAVRKVIAIIFATVVIVGLVLVVIYQPPLTPDLPPPPDKSGMEAEVEQEPAKGPAAPVNLAAPVGELPNTTGP